MTSTPDERAPVGVETLPHPGGPSPAVPAPDADLGARFTHGPVLRHVLVMTATGAVGTLSIFAVDLLSLVYVSHLGSTALKAAAGFATQVLVYPAAINIGLTIAVTAAVSKALGGGRRARARRLVASGLLLTGLVGVAVTLAALAGAGPLLATLGARGETRDVAEHFLRIALPGNVPFALGMALSGVLRAVGDARRAMSVTLAGGIVTALLDPLLIFGLHLGIDGAAVSTLVSRFVLLGVGLHGVGRVHGLLGGTAWILPRRPASSARDIARGVAGPPTRPRVGRPRLRALGLDGRVLSAVAVPAVAANLATPAGNGYALHVYAGFGDAAVAASAVIDRTVYVAFAAVFALTGAVGPILGQNLGARLYGRVSATLTQCFAVTVGYALATWLALAALWPVIARAFDASPAMEAYLRFFCTWGVAAWLFIGLLFVANAAFNNLGFPVLATLFNWGRATLGTAPFVTLGARLGGVDGGMLGMAAGAAVFGIAATATAYRVVARLDRPPPRP